MGPKPPGGGPRATCWGPPTSEGGPPGTPAPYWKSPQGRGPVQKFDQYGNPLAPGDQGHEQDSWKGGAPKGGEPAPQTETPFPGEPVAPEMPEIPELPVIALFP